LHKYNIILKRLGRSTLKKGSKADDLTAWFCCKSALGYTVRK